MKILLPIFCLFFSYSVQAGQEFVVTNTLYGVVTSSKQNMKNGTQCSMRIRSLDLNDQSLVAARVFHIPSTARDINLQFQLDFKNEESGVEQYVAQLEDTTSYYTITVTVLRDPREQLSQLFAIKSYTIKRDVKLFYKPGVADDELYSCGGLTPFVTTPI